MNQDKLMEMNVTGEARPKAESNLPGNDSRLEFPLINMEVS